MTKKFKQKKNSESGLALLIAIFTLLLLTAIGAGMVMLTNTDTSISANFRDEQTAFFAAKAGIEEVRDRFRNAASNSLTSPSFQLPTVWPGSGSNGVVYLTNANAGETVTPWTTTNLTNYGDDEICTELANTAGVACSGTPTGSWYANPANASTSYAPATGTKLPWKWARITLKTNLTSSGTSNGTSTLSAVDGTTTHVAYWACWTGSTEVAIPNTYAGCGSYPVTPPYQPIYVITALAQTPSGSRRMVQAEATAQTFPSIPGPLVFDGPSPVFSTPSSNVFAVNGNNSSGPSNSNGPGSMCPSGQSAEYALGAANSSVVTPNPDVTTLQTDASNRPNSYIGLGNTNGTTGTASAGNVYSQLGTLNSVSGLQSLVSSITLVAGNEGNVYTTNTSSLTNPGTIANPQVNVVQGNLTLGGGWSGAGILLVTGTLTFNGNPNYDGLILVIGSGTVVKNGGGNGTIDGSMLVANINSGSLGSPNVTWNGGGNVQYNYDSCWSTQMSNLFAYRIVGVREIIR